MSSLNHTPGIPIPFDYTKFWTMYYRHGMNALLSKNFFFDGNLHGAVEEAQRHCGIMGYKYHFIRPMVSDIKKEETIQLGHLDKKEELVSK